MALAVRQNGSLIALMYVLIIALSIIAIAFVMFKLTSSYMGGLGTRPTTWMIVGVGQGPIAHAVGAGGGCLDIFTLLYLFSPFSLSLGDGRK